MTGALRASRGHVVSWTRVGNYFEVTTTSGYRATLPACECDRSVCRCRAKKIAVEHACVLCHNWHAKRVADFAALVAKTYA